MGSFNYIGSVGSELSYTNLNKFIYGLWFTNILILLITVNLFVLFYEFI